MIWYENIFCAFSISKFCMNSDGLSKVYQRSDGLSKAYQRFQHAHQAEAGQMAYVGPAAYTQAERQPVFIEPDDVTQHSACVYQHLGCGPKESSYDFVDPNRISF